MNLFPKQKETQGHRKQSYGYQRVCGGDKLGVWDEHIHTAIYKIGKQQGTTV